MNIRQCSSRRTLYHNAPRADKPKNGPRTRPREIRQIVRRDERNAAEGKERAFGGVPRRISPRRYFAVQASQFSASIVSPPEVLQVPFSHVTVSVVPSFFATVTVPLFLFVT